MIRRKTNPSKTLPQYESQEKTKKLKRKQVISMKYVFIFIIGSIFYTFKNQNPKQLTMKEARIRNTMEYQNSKNKALLTPLSSNDKEYYTIRINTYRRNEQLLISINHFSKCEGVQLIQVIWCDHENDPPFEITNHTKVQIEYHSVNTLNERFHIIHTPPTLGILSIDDDVLRPCEALDVGFIKWTMYPHRMVGYDSRLHLIQDDHHWKYGYKSDTDRANQYSMTLTRFAFIHRDYMNLYYSRILPLSIFLKVSETFECEDIAMSFFISSLTCGKPPLLAQTWAVQTMVKLYSPSGAISSKSNHKIIRDQCVDMFADLLQLKPLHSETSCIINPTLKTSTLNVKSIFNHGAKPDQNETFIYQQRAKNDLFISRLETLENKLLSWNKNTFQKSFDSMIAQTQEEALSKGFIAHTPPWKKRWNKK